MRYLLLLLTFVSSLSMNAQAFKVGSFIPMIDDWIVGGSYCYDGPFFHGRNAYSSMFSPGIKVSVSRYYSMKRGLHLEAGYLMQDIVHQESLRIYDVDVTRRVNNTNCIFLMGNDMWSLTEMFFDKRTDNEYTWDLYYGAGIAFVNSHKIEMYDNGLAANQTVAVYPIIGVGTRFRYMITKRLEAFGDLSCKFSATNMTHIQNGSHIFGELGVGLNWRIPNWGPNHYKPLK